MKAIKFGIWGTLTVVTVAIPAALGLYHLIPAALAIGILWSAGASLVEHYNRIAVIEKVGVAGLIPAGVQGVDIGTRHHDEPRRRSMAFTGWGTAPTVRPPQLPEGDWWDNRPEAQHDNDVVSVADRVDLRPVGRWLAGRAWAAWTFVWMGLVWMSVVDIPLGAPEVTGRHRSPDLDDEPEPAPVEEPSPAPIPDTTALAGVALRSAAPDWQWNTDTFQIKWDSFFAGLPDDQARAEEPSNVGA